jgi:drug/metabolite transporter (DMT)-like permease
MKPRWPSAYLLLMLTTLFWSGNFVLARAVHLQVPPIGLSFWRWSLAGLILLPFVWRNMAAKWSLVRCHLLLVIALALLGVSSFNTLVYLGLQTTTASNGVLLQSIIPLVIILLSRLILGLLVTAGQGLGILASLLGVLIIITRGDLQVLLQLAVTRGDLLVLAAVIAWGFYSTLLKKLPTALRGLPLLGYTIAIGVVGIAPFYAWEIAQGTRMTLSAVTLTSVGYVAIFPSLLAYLFWNRAIEQLGPNRSGQFIHLMPVFGSLLSVSFLGERLHLYHLVGILFVAAGIYIATLRGDRGQETEGRRQKTEGRR